MHVPSSSRFALCAATAPLLATLLACGPRAEPSGAASRPAPLVEALRARFGALPIEEVVPGVVRARNQVAIRPEIEGRIVEVLVRSGDAVEQGQPLVRLDAVEANERLRQAEADVRLAEAAAAAARARVAELDARLARTRRLAEQELVSAQELDTQDAQLAVLRASADESKARVEQARAAAQERRSALAKTVVRAPVAGRLGERLAEVGMRVDPQTVLFVVGDLDELIVEVDLTEGMLRRVEAGLPVVVETRATPGAPLRAEISRISPFLAERSFSARGEVDVDNRDGRLQPGMFATVRILVGQSRRATLVPVGAIWEDPGSGERGVFVVDEAAGLEPPASPDTSSPDESRSVSFRRVEVLAEGRGTAGVAGVDEGAWVVTLGQNLLGNERRLAAEAGAAASGPGAAKGPAAPQTRARVRPTTWERVLALQDLQNEDLLDGFLEKQRKVASALGAEIPESEDVVERVLRDAAASGASGAAEP